MHKPVPQDAIDALQALADAAGAVVKSITPVRVCDRCQDEDKEAFPFYASDPTGKHWDHLCSECYDELGCRLVVYRAVTCAGCGQAIGEDDEAHWGHEPGCPNGCDTNLDNDDQEHICDCDLYYHPDCCPDCQYEEGNE